MYLYPLVLYPLSYLVYMPVSFSTVSSILSGIYTCILQYCILYPIWYLYLYPLVLYLVSYLVYIPVSFSTVSSILSGIYTCIFQYCIMYSIWYIYLYPLVLYLVSYLVFVGTCILQYCILYSIISFISLIDYIRLKLKFPTLCFILRAMSVPVSSGSVFCICIPHSISLYCPQNSTRSPRSHSYIKLHKSVLTHQRSDPPVTMYRRRPICFPDI